MENEKLEAGEKISSLQKILENWEDKKTEPTYRIPVFKKELENNGKCRLLVDFKSIEDAENFVSKSFLRGEATMFAVDSLVENAVRVDRTFVLRRPGGMPSEFQLQKVTVTVEPLGGNL